MKTLFTLIWLSFLASHSGISLSPSFAKNKTVTNQIINSTSDTIVLKGKVTENKIPFPKANVKLKGTEIHTLTDLNGEFVLKIPPGIEMQKFTLIISYVGMITKEITVKKTNKKIKVQIKPERTIIE